jgi:D-alanyl-D-alanine carboxypeptidase
MRPYPLIAAIALLLAACSGGGSAPLLPTPAPDQAGPAPEIRPLDQPVPSSTPEPPRVLVPTPWAPAPTESGVPAPAVTALAAVVIDEASGAVLYDKQAERVLPPASLTKIATAVIALEEGDLDSTVVVDVNSEAMKGSTVMGLLPGDHFTLRDLLYGLMLPSGNDAAIAIGRHIAGSDEAFAEKLNALARRFALNDTQFANAHGLSRLGHVTSAHDLAILSRYAMSVPGFAEIVGTPYWTALGSRTIELTNLHPFTFSYPGGDGIKTGYTGRAGRTMVASAVRDGHRVYVVLLNAPEMEKDAVALMDWAFATHRWLV